MTAVFGAFSFFLLPFLLAPAPGPQDASPPLPVYRLPPVVVEAPRLSPAPHFPGARTVLDRHWLERRRPLDLADALDQAAGLRVASLGAAGSRAVSVRGLGPDRTAVLVDGLLRNTAQGGGVDLAALDLEGVERIEVARGSMGALYGPYALGGAVQVVSREDRRTAGSVRLLAGTHDRGEVRARLAWTRDRVSAGAEGGWADAAPDLDGREAGSSSRNGVLRLSYHPAWASEIRASLEGMTDARDVPGSRAFPTPAARRRDAMSQAVLSLRGVRAFHHPGLFEVSVSGLRFERRYSDPGYPLGAVDDVHRNRRDEVVLGWQDAGPAWTVALRGEGTRDRLESTTDGSRARDRGAVAGHVEAGRGGWGVSGALRLDALEGFSPEATARASLSRTLWGQRGGEGWVAARVGGGTAFRPPTFDDLFWPARATAAGNPHLRPERSRDLDVGLEARGGDARLDLCAYRARVEDLIQWVPGPDGAWRPHNLGRARLQGVEMEGSLAFPLGRGEVFLDAAVSRSTARDDTGDPTTGGNQLVGRPHWIGSGSIAWQPGALGASIGFRGVDRTPLTAANTKWLEGRLLWDAGLSWRARPGLRLALEGRNLLDADYEDLRGYATPGREILVSMQFHAESEDR